VYIGGSVALSSGYIREEREIAESLWGKVDLQEGKSFLLMELRLAFSAGGGGGGAVMAAPGAGRGCHNGSWPITRRGGYSGCWIFCFPRLAVLSVSAPSVL
jgi:hypothetical protein